MKIEYSDIGDYKCFCSAFYAFSLCSTAPRIGHLGIESGARTRRHMDCNLLKPGLAAVPSKWKRLGKESFTVLSTPKKVSYSCIDKANSGRTDMTFVNERSVNILFETEKHFSGDFFEFSFGNDVAPLTTWAMPSEISIVSAEGTGRKPDAKGKIINSYRLPLVLHFPDYGLLKIECDSKDVICVEELVGLKEMTGLGLGYKNNGYHNAMFAYHHGTVTLKFHALSKIKKGTLKLTVEKENFPNIKDCDFHDSKWNGLKRCWMNSFTLDKRSLTMGDNIALGGVAHLAMHFKSDLLLHTPQLPNGIRVQDFLKRALITSFEECQSISGEINWEYRNNPEKKQKMATFIDSTPSILIAFCNNFLHDRDAKFANKYVSNALNAAKFLMGLDEDGDGIIEVPFHGNFFEEIHGRNRNWWDNFAFGHKDIYFNLLCHRALRLLRELAAELGLDTDAAELQIFLGKFDSCFDRTFFNPKTGVYAGWISRDGKVHDYMFTFASAMAINEGLVPKRKAVGILGKLLEQLDASGFSSFQYGVPGPAIPVAAKDTINWDFMGKWPRYENGGLCGQNAYHFIQALYSCGLRRQADKILFVMLSTFEKEPTHSGLMPGYMKSLDWRMKDGHPCGYNYLADNYYFLLAAVTGHFGKAVGWQLPACG
ncbi:MAG: hypothetical protein WCS65_10720 [Verrucomicrobiae bacterium]